MRRSWCVSGFTLLELLIYQGLLTLLMGGLYITVHAGMRYLRTSDVYQDVIRQSHIGFSKMAQELANGSQLSLNFNAAPTQHAMFLSPDVPLPNKANWTYSGTDLQYHKWVCFYRSTANRSLVRCELALGTPATALSIPAFPDFATELQPEPTTILARFIETLEFSAGTTPSYLTINIVADRDTASDRHTQLQVRAEVRLENS